MADAVLAAAPEPTTLEDFLRGCIDAGLGYEATAKELHSATNGTVSVSYMTVKRWLADFQLLKAAS